MADTDLHQELIAEAARKNGILPGVLEDLLRLETEFTDFTQYGAKIDFTRRVAKILDDAATKGTS